MTTICDNCKNLLYCNTGRRSAGGTGLRIHRCEQYEAFRTNADSFSTMDTADLAALCASPCPPDQTCGRNMVAPLPECLECWKKWLESPVEVDNG